MKALTLSFFRSLKTFFLPVQENGFYPYSLRTQALVFYALIIVAIKVLTIGSGVIFPKTGFFADVSQQLVLYLTNQERQRNGLAVLNENPVLDAAARQKAMDMVTNNYFAHISPQGVTPWHWFKANGYSYRYAGENLAIDFLESSDVVDAWMSSPTHRQNVLNNNYQDIGVAVVQGMVEGQNTTVVVQMFGTPKVAVVPPIPALSVVPSPSFPQVPSAQTEQTPTPEPVFTAEPVVAGEINVSPTPTPYTGPVISKPGAVAGAYARSMAAWNFVMETVSDPSWLYWLMLGYLVAAAVLGIFSRVYTPQPGAFIGAVLLIALTVVMIVIPGTDEIWQWNVRVV